MEIEAKIFEGETVDATAKYDASVDQQAIVVAFAVSGKRSLLRYASAGTSAGSVVMSSRSFFLDIDAEASQLGWQENKQIKITVDKNSYRLILA